MKQRFNYLGPKLTLIALTFFLLLAVITALLVNRGFRNTQDTATQRSIEGLEAQALASLQSLVEREARISTDQLQRGADAGRYAAQFMANSAQVGLEGSRFSFDQLERHANGVLFDADPARVSEVWIPNFLEPNAQLADDMQVALALDALLPILKESYPAMAAISYVNTQGASRYFPVTGLADLAPPDVNLTQEAFYLIGTPAENPSRSVVWTPPYVDLAGQGLLVSSIAPVYIDDEFRGIISVDISLNGLIAQLNTLKATPSGYAFLVDNQGHLIAAPPAGIADLATDQPVASTSVTASLGLDLNRRASPAFAGVLQAMSNGERGVRRLMLGGKEVFLAYAPLSNTGWGLGIVSPVAEEVAQSAAVAGAIRRGTDETFSTTLLTMGAFFLLALVGTTVLSRRLTRPIQTLVEGTRAISAGNLNVNIPITSRDELGMLAESFNTMTAELGAARQRLETWNQTLEHTVEQRTAELVRAKAEAEQANTLKSQFLANMSHELRTPLNSIINFAYILQTGLRGEINAEQKDYLSRIHNSGEHLLGLINDILDLSKIEAGRLDLYKEPLNIGDLARSVMSTISGLIKDRPIELREELAPDLPIVIADSTRVRQVLLNLLSNAAKFTDEGAITVRAEVQDAAVVVSVSDTGVGIPADQLNDIFEEFRQVEGSTSRRYEGTGLGLAICRRMVELHGGTIWAESRSGEGSTFSFSLPLQQEPAAAEPAAPLRQLAPAQQDHRAILIIDDDAASSEIIAAYLNKDGYAIYSVSDSRQAVAEARRLQPAAIILDILMPYKDGWEVLAELKSDASLQQVPVLLYTIVEDQKLGYYLGASAYLTKPINESQLRATVARLVSHGANILVIDDDPNSRDILSHHLRQSDSFKVVTADGGLEGLAQIATDRPDLIVLDLMMPEVDGFAVLEALEANQETRAIPVIVLTAKDLSADERELLNQRVHGLLLKGQVSPGQILDNVAHVLKLSGSHAQVARQGEELLS